MAVLTFEMITIVNMRLRHHRRSPPGAAPALAVGLVLFLLFNSLLQAADLTATLKQHDGSTAAPAAGTRFLLYTAPLREIYDANPATFTAVPANVSTGYLLEAYHTGTFLGEEFWTSDASVLVGSDPNASVTLTRNYPFAEFVAVTDSRTGAAVAAGQFLASATPIALTFTVRNNTGVSMLPARVRLLIDRDLVEPYDLDQTSPVISIPAAGTRPFSFSWSPTAPGEYSFALEVMTTLESGNVIRTDSWDWTPTFQISPPPEPDQEFFDDFAYADSADPRLRAFGWHVRTGQGGPGPALAEWNPDYVIFEDDPDLPGSTLIRMTASTSGTSASCRQSEISTPRRFLEGAYCARIRFTDQPRQGTPQPAVQAFYTINSLRFDYDPLYSECDFEYLSRDAWQACGPDPCLYMTTWETFRPDPPDLVRQYNARPGSLAAWHTLCFQVFEGHVRYFVDGVPAADHPGDVYPESPMSIAFQHWFAGGLNQIDSIAVYTMDIDWIYHRPGAPLSTADVEILVETLRAQGVPRRNTMPGDFIPGDVNADAGVDGNDIQEFVDILLGIDTGQARRLRADMDASGTVDAIDIAPFIAALVAN